MTERTLFIIKPDAVEAKNEGKMLDILLRHGFIFRRLELMKLDRGIVEELYAEHRDKPFYRPLVEFMTSGAVIAGIVEKENAIADLRRLAGATDPANAAEGTIRRQFGTDRTSNAIHTSDSAASAAREERILPFNRD